MDNQYPGKHVREMCTPLHPTFMYKIWGLQGSRIPIVNIFIVYSVEPPRRYGAKVYPQSMC